MSNPLFILARHGRTAGNERNIYRGWSNAEFAQLDEEGKRDAKDAGIYMKGLEFEFPVILVDDLARTQETARIIAGILGIKEIITDKRLRPVNVGDLTGKSKVLYPLDEYTKNPSKQIPGGESINQFNARKASVFGDILEALTKLRQQTGRPVMFLIIGHGSNASFLYHAVNKGGKEIGYEGMTEPGGIMAFTKDALTALFKKKDPKDAKKPQYPPDHKPGMKVPKGGSNCAKCEYLKDADKKLCGNEYFIKWNGSELIPGEIDAYCSDYFESKKKED
jgi:broad specificity phosphatase PhoE